MGLCIDFELSQQLNDGKLTANRALLDNKNIMLCPMPAYGHEYVRLKWIYMKRSIHEVTGIFSRAIDYSMIN